MSVSAIKGEALDTYNASGQDVRALSGRVPSLNIESDFGRTFLRFYIRGLGDTDFDLNASQPVTSPGAEPKRHRHQEPRGRQGADRWKSDAVATHGKAAVEQDGQGIAAQWRVRRARVLCVDMQMRLTGVARVPHRAQPDARGDGVAHTDLDASRAQMAEQHVGLIAAQHDVVARHVLAVHLRHLHVGQTVHRQHDPASARCQNAGAVDAIGPRVCRLQTLRAQPEAIQPHEIDAIGLPAPVAEPGHAGIERFDMGVGAGVAAAVDDEVAARLQRECQVHRWQRRHRPAAPCSDDAVG